MKLFVSELPAELSDHTAESDQATYDSIYTWWWHSNPALKPQHMLEQH